MSSKGKGRDERPFEVIVNMPDPLPITSDELRIIETYMRDIVLELVEPERDAPPEA